MTTDSLTPYQTPEAVADHVAVLERENEDLRKQSASLRHTTNTLRRQLEQERVRAERLERQIAGYDEDLFDPGKQKGIGAIPVDVYGGIDLREVEHIEARLGMGPTVDRPTLSAGVPTARQIGAGDEETAVEDVDQSDYIDAVVERDKEKLHARALQALWFAHRAVMDEGFRAGAQGRQIEDAESGATLFVLPDGFRRVLSNAVVALPVSLFRDALDIDGWDPEADELPPLKG